MMLNKKAGVQVRAGATGTGQSHLRNAAWCERENIAKRSFRRVGAAQEGSHVGFAAVDGQFEGSFAVTAAQRVGWQHSSASAHGGHMSRTWSSRRRPIWRGRGVLQLLYDLQRQTSVGGSIHSCSGRGEKAMAGMCVMVRMMILDIEIIVNKCIGSI
jgi:hypothetical protein